MDKEREEQWKEERKRNKSKFIPILHRKVPTLPLIVVSALAIQRMDKGDYVPLWYFTNAGLDYAAKAFSILEEDALLLVKRDNGSTSLVLALSFKESRSIAEDSKLPLDDFCIAAPYMILAMSRSQTPLLRVWGSLSQSSWVSLSAESLRLSPHIIQKHGKKHFTKQASQKIIHISLQGSTTAFASVSLLLTAHSLPLIKIP